MRPTVYLILGLPGAGKTTFSKKLQQDLGISRLSLDEEYSKLGGDLADPKWNLDIEAEANETIKHQMKLLVARGESIILDFCPWKKEDRRLFNEYIRSIGAKPHIYFLNVKISELKRRLKERNEDLSDNTHIVTAEMLDAFTTRFDPPLQDEYELVDTFQPELFRRTANTNK